MNNWTTICYDVDNGVMKPYVRITPDFMINPGWGLSMHRFHETAESAQAEANEIENFMNHMMLDFFDDVEDMWGNFPANQLRERFKRTRTE